MNDKTSFGGVLPLLVATAIGFAVTASAAEPAKSNPEHQSPAMTKSIKEMQEDFLKLKFGMFIHYNMATTRVSNGSRAIRSRPPSIPEPRSTRTHGPMRRSLPA